MNSDKFYKDLSKVPELDNDLFNKIEKGIEQKNRQKHKVLALAASIVLALGILFYNVKDNFNNISSSVAISDEVVEELQIIGDYISGDGIDDEIEMYAYSGIY